MLRAEEAIVLAGGLGTRLRAEVADRPKPLALVAGRPFLGYVLDQFADAGFRRVVLATGYLSDAITQEIGTRWRGMEIDYSREDTPLGTGGAVALAAAMLRSDSVHVANGDTFLRFDHVELERAAQRAGSSIALALARVGDVGRYGAVDVHDGKVVAFLEKGGNGPGWINAGQYFLDRDAIAALPRGEPFSFEARVLLPAASRGELAALEKSAEFIDIGIPEDFHLAQRVFAATAGGGTARALFLDRDGVINVDSGYVHTAAATQWVPGIFDLCRRAADLGYLLVVVTNQAGIARGYYSEQDFLTYSQWMRDEFAARGIPLAAIYHCPHHPTAGPEAKRVPCDCRKPAPGMLLRAARELGLNLSRSALIGDQPWDIEAANRAGVAHSLRLGTDGVAGDGLCGMAEAINWISKLPDIATNEGTNALR